MEDIVSRFSFLIDTYDTERLKTLGVWSQVPDDRMQFRPEPRARSPLEHMIHQCVSEDTWMRTMLGIAVSHPALPVQETRLAFLEHYAASSAEPPSLEAGPTWFDDRHHSSTSSAARRADAALTHWRITADGDGLPAAWGQPPLDLRSDRRHRRPFQHGARVHRYRSLDDCWRRSARRQRAALPARDR
jgi:hypothetical protein